MAGERYAEEFKIAAASQVTDNDRSTENVANYLGILTNSWCGWRD